VLDDQLRRAQTLVIVDIEAEYRANPRRQECGLI
jgi:hypothetical protein